MTESKKEAPSTSDTRARRLAEKMGEKADAPRRLRCSFLRARVLCLLALAALAARGVYFGVLMVLARRFDQRLLPPDPAVSVAVAHGARAVLEALLEDGAPPHVIIDACFGLGNRMRTVASAMAVAAAARRPLLVIWVPDGHMNCSIHALFAGPLPFAVLEEALPIAWLPTARFQAFNYMPGEAGAVKREWVRMHARQHLFVRSAYRVAHERGEWPYTMRKLRELRPLPPVAAQLVADSSMIGLHVRGVVDAISDYGANGTAALAQWRERTSWPKFVARMRREPANRRFYLAADSPAAYEGLAAAFPGQLAFAARPARCRLEGSRCDIERGCEASSAALVDILNLARTQRVLGSFYSSFSEVARYYGVADWQGNELPFEAAGVDF